MKDYVLGFAFSRDKQNVLLINKLSPDWQRGKLNGIGGKIELEDDCPFSAMIREFGEETGLNNLEIQKDLITGWNHFGTMNFGQSKVYLFKMFSDYIFEAKSPEQEQTTIIKVSDIITNNYIIIPNLLHLIPLALQDEFKYTEFTS